MTKLLMRRRAIELRQRRLSYSQIKRELGVSKSTLSRWLQNYPLTLDEIRALCADREKEQKPRLTL